MLLLALTLLCWSDVALPCHCDEDQACGTGDVCACLCCVTPITHEGLSFPGRLPMVESLAGADLFPPEDLPTAIDHPPQIA
jgi:hypothetical protein